tara:strand:+ start:169 stop:546 length:378 start_codon:yes stop_codon:yes gene_type:complete
VLAKLVLVGVGGAFGALARYGLSLGIHSLLGRGFPYGTLTVNVIGSALIGVVHVLALERSGLSEEWRLGVTMGVLAAFTTFSTFSIETVALLESGEVIKAVANTLLNLALCIGGCWAGITLTRQL